MENSIPHTQNMYYGSANTNLGCFHIIDTIEGEAELLGFILRIWYSDDVIWLLSLAALCSYDGVFVEFFVEEGSNPRHDSNRHYD
jgi:hypothetical protein